MIWRNSIGAAKRRHAPDRPSRRRRAFRTTAGAPCVAGRYIRLVGRLSLLAMFIASPAWALEPAHCYRDPPADALPGKSPSPFSFIDYAFGPTIAWRVCGYEMTRHAEVWRAFYTGHGCSAKSDAGQMFEKLLLGPAPAWDEETIALAHAEAPDLFAEWCGAWRGYVMPPYDQIGIHGNHDEASDAARAGLAILEETDRLAKEIGEKLGLR